jgi:hypothetical protein
VGWVGKAVRFFSVFLQEKSLFRNDSQIYSKSVPRVPVLRIAAGAGVTGVCRRDVLGVDAFGGRGGKCCGTRRARWR